MQIRRIFGVVAALGISGSLLASDPEPADVVIAFKLLANRPVVDVTINGKGPFPFVLDTGAGVTTLNADLVEELHLTAVGSTTMGDPAHPHSIPAKKFRIDVLTVGGVPFTKVDATSFDNAALSALGGPRGVLGMPLWADRLMTLDYPRSQVDLRRGALPTADGREVIASKRGHGGTFSISIRVAGVTVDADVDSGSPGGVLLPQKYVARLPLEAQPVVIGHARTVSGEFDVSSATLKGALEIGSYHREGPSIRFADYLPIGNIGYEVLRRFAVTIDQANNRVRFEEGPPVAEEKPAVAVEASAPLGDYVGRFGQRTISLDGSRLTLQREGGPKLELVPAAPDEFTLRQVPEARIKFVRNAEGKVAELDVMNFGGQWEKAPREP